MENPNLIPPLLPDELVFEILSKLPVKSLLQLKSVCKSWKTLISNSQFTKTHLHNLTVTPSITHKRLLSKTSIAEPCRIVSFPVKSLLKNSLDAATKHVEIITKKEYFILGSCNGLLCLFDTDQCFVKLWNPSIGLKSKNSPKLTDCYSYRGFGFGYDHANDMYKVVVSIVTSFSKHVTQIYTFGENSWTTIHNFPRQSETKLSLGKFVSGTLNWVMVKSGVSYHNVILSFDLQKETCKELLLPENDGVKASNHALGVLDNCLCVCFNSNEIHWDFWLMKKYGVAESWTRLMMIPDEKLRLSLQHSPCFNIEPLFFFENRIVLLDIFSKLVLYNLNNGRLDALPYRIWSYQHIYTESLVSPKL